MCLGHTFVPLGVSVSSDDMWSRWSLRTLSLLSLSTQAWLQRGLHLQDAYVGPTIGPTELFQILCIHQPSYGLHMPIGGKPMAGLFPMVHSGDSPGSCPPVQLFSLHTGPHFPRGEVGHVSPGHTQASPNTHRDGEIVLHVLPYDGAS